MLMYVPNCFRVDILVVSLNHGRFCSYVFGLRLIVRPEPKKNFFGTNGDFSRGKVRNDFEKGDPLWNGKLHKA